MTETDEIENKNFISNEEFDSKYALRVMLILAGLVLIVMYIEGMLTPSLPAIESQFKISTAQASLLLSTYLVGGGCTDSRYRKIRGLVWEKEDAHHCSGNLLRFCGCHWFFTHLQFYDSSQDNSGNRPHYHAIGNEFGKGRISQGDSSKGTGIDKRYVWSRIRSFPSTGFPYIK